jgi:hypothetical protein
MGGLVKRRVFQGGAHASTPNRDERVAFVFEIRANDCPRQAAGVGRYRIDRASETQPMVLTG